MFPLSVSLSGPLGLSLYFALSTVAPSVQQTVELEEMIQYHPEKDKALVNTTSTPSLSIEREFYFRFSLHRCSLCRNTVTGSGVLHFTKGARVCLVKLFDSEIENLLQGFREEDKRRTRAVLSLMMSQLMGSSFLTCWVLSAE